MSKITHSNDSSHMLNENGQSIYLQNVKFLSILSIMHHKKPLRKSVPIANLFTEKTSQMSAAFSKINYSEYVQIT